MIDPMAKQLAARADAVVLAVGFDRDVETESADREFALPPVQAELIREISAVNPNIIVVITSGGSVDVAPWMDRAKAIVAAWFPGQEGGSALASLLLGETNFSGRLPISWERSVADNPAYANYYYNDPAHRDRIAYREGVFVGYRGYQEAKVKPLFPFGFGLSYTAFQYGNLTVKPKAGAGQPTFEVSFDVTNTGERSGADVPQIYVGAVKPRVPRPPRELKGFARVDLARGETKRMTVELDARAFAYYDVEAKGWQVDAGQYSVELGASAEAIQSRANVTIARAARLQ
jgi:beta-glucosidase